VGSDLNKAIHTQVGKLPKGEPKRPTLPEISMYFEEQGRRQNLLLSMYDVFKKSKTPKRLPPTHSLIAKLPKITGSQLIIITTNYDHYMESSFSQNNVDYICISHVTNPNSASHQKLIIFDKNGKHEIKSCDELDQSWPQNKSIIYKMHGNLIDKKFIDKDMIVLTEYDYYNFASLHMEKIPKKIISAIMENDVLYLGYSLVDWNLRLFLFRAIIANNGKTYKGLLRRPKNTANWAISKKFNWVEKLFWDRYDVATYNEDLANIIPALAQDLGVTL